MPREPRFPSYPRKPHSSGQARIKVRGHAHYLGKFGSPESWAEYHRLLAEWRAGRLDAQAPAPGACRTVAELVAHWWTWAGRSQLEPGGALKKEVENRRHAYGPLVEVFGQTPVIDFTAKVLLRLQEEMARRWCRNVVNRATSRVKALFRWGELHGHVPEGQTGKLAVVKGLAEGEHGVRETDEVPPVPEAVYLATLPHLRPVVRAVVQLLALTGARPSEILGLRPSDLNRTGVVELARGYRVELGAGVWAYQPRRHKTSRKGCRRVILFGPRAQAVLAPFLEGRADDACLFQPAEEVRRLRQDQRRARKSRVQPSQIDRSKPDPKRKPGERYTHRALGCAVRRATEKVIGPVPGAGPCPHWSPYALRHLAATLLAEEFGAEVAMTLLGHKHLKTTAIYALPSLKKAADAAKQAG